MKQGRVVVVGAGASGILAAITAAKQGAKVTLLERNTKIGKKILATGNGRCNLANVGAFRYNGGALFAEHVFSVISVKEVLSTLESLGLALTQKEDRIYPLADQASVVVEVLKNALSRMSIQVECNQTVTSVKKSETTYQVQTHDGLTYEGERVILAVGSPAGGNLGSPLASYALAKNLGHSMTPLLPALTSLIAKKGDVRDLSGMRIHAIVSLRKENATVLSTQGEVLFSDYGVSGICIMQLALAAQHLLAKSDDVSLSLDFSPMLGIGEKQFGSISLHQKQDNINAVKAMLDARAKAMPKEDILLGLLPMALYKKLRKERPYDLPKWLTDYPVRIVEARPFENAQVANGGIDTREVFPYTMQSMCSNGLYLTGEMLDVDGDCGGFNLMFAFASGILAGKKATETLM